MWRTPANQFRVLRRHLRLRQRDLAARTGLSRSTIGRIENGDWSTVGVGALQRVADALGARLQLWLAWQGERLDRLVDAGHAELQNAFATMLTSAGWLVTVEVSFNHFGERGRYDLLAYHPPTGILLVVEIKTAIGDVQATLGGLDIKVRLARQAASRLGWPPPRTIVPALVVADERQQHRVVAAHSALFAGFAGRGRTARAWIKSPAAGGTGLLVFLPMTNARLTSLRVANRGVRVRNGRLPKTSAAPGGPMSTLQPDSPP